MPQTLASWALKHSFLAHEDGPIILCWGLRVSRQVGSHGTVFQKEFLEGDKVSFRWERDKNTSLWRKLHHITLSRLLKSPTELPNSSKKGAGLGGLGKVVPCSFLTLSQTPKWAWNTPLPTERVLTACAGLIASCGMCFPVSDSMLSSFALRKHMCHRTLANPTTVSVHCRRWGPSVAQEGCLQAKCLLSAAEGIPAGRGGLTWTTGVDSALPLLYVNTALFHPMLGCAVLYLVTMIPRRSGQSCYHFCFWW